MSAIALIESNRRPTYVRFIENSLLLLNAALHVLGLIRMKDVTIGMCQVSLSTAARLSGVPCTVQDGWLSVGASASQTRLDKLRRVQRLLKAVTSL